MKENANPGDFGGDEIRKIPEFMLEVSILMTCYVHISIRVNLRQKSTALGIPRRSPIQVLTELNVA